MKVKEALIMVFLGVLFFALLHLFMPPALNIYKSISTREVVKIETNKGTVTDKEEIKKLLDSWSDQEVYWVP